MILVSCNSSKINKDYDEIKDSRFKLMFDKFEEIRNVQLAYYHFNHRYSNNFTELISFIESEKFPILTVKDTLVNEERIIMKDTLSFVKVKDSLFKNSDSYLNLGSIQINGKKFPLELTLTDNQNNEGQDKQSFKVKIRKEHLLSGADNGQIKKEKITGDYFYFDSKKEKNPNFD